MLHRPALVTGLGKLPRPAGWQPALPKPARRVRSPIYSPAFRLKLATAYSRFNFAMKLALIEAGQTASHS